MLPSFRERHGKQRRCNSGGPCKGAGPLPYRHENLSRGRSYRHAGYQLCRKKAQAAIQAFKDGFDLVYLHLEAPDECGHRHEVEGKVKAIEEIDSRCWPRVQISQIPRRFRILVTPDHPTPLPRGRTATLPCPSSSTAAMSPR